MHCNTKFHLGQKVIVTRQEQEDIGYIFQIIFEHQENITYMVDIGSINIQAMLNIPEHRKLIQVSEDTIRAEL